MNRYDMTIVSSQQQGLELSLRRENQYYTFDKQMPQTLSFYILCYVYVLFISRRSRDLTASRWNTKQNRKRDSDIDVRNVIYSLYNEMFPIATVL